MKKTIFFFLFSFSIYSQQLETIQGGSCFELQIPSYFIKTYELNEDAILQYYHSGKEAYWLMIDQDKAMLQSRGVYFNDVKDFTENLVLDFQKSARNRKLNNIQLLSNEDVNIAQTEITLTDDQGKEISFYIAVIETVEKYYKFYGWTIENNRNIIFPDFKFIVESFKP